MSVLFLFPFVTLKRQTFLCLVSRQSIGYVTQICWIKTGARSRQYYLYKVYNVYYTHTSWISNLIALIWDVYLAKKNKFQSRNLTYQDQISQWLIKCLKLKKNKNPNGTQTKRKRREENVSSVLVLKMRYVQNWEKFKNSEPIPDCSDIVQMAYCTYRCHAAGKYCYKFSEFHLLGIRFGRWIHTSERCTRYNCLIGCIIQYNSYCFGHNSRRCCTNDCQHPYQ